MRRFCSLLLLIWGPVPLGTGCSTISEEDIEVGTASLAAVVPVESAAEPAPGWHEWRGFAKDGVVAGVTLPETAPEEPWPELWRVWVGRGFSGVVAAEGKVFCHGRRSNEEVVTCHEAASGRKLWSHAYPISPWNQPIPAFGITDGPLATPTYAAGRLYTVAIHGRVYCLDAEDGNVIFTVSAQGVDRQPSKYLYGHASSPLVREGKLYITYSTGRGGQVIALDAVTGRVLWRAIEETVAYVSPVHARIHDKHQIVVRTWERIVGLDPQTGDILWQHEAESSGIRRDCATPLVVGDVIFVTNNFHGTIALRVVKLDDGSWHAERLYRTGALGGAMASPVYHHGYLYGLHKKRRFVCMDAATGKRQWGVRGFGNYLSMISFGARVLALDERGLLAILSLSPEGYREEAAWKVGEYTWGHPGVDERHFFFRDGEELVCLALH